MKAFTVFEISSPCPFCGNDEWEQENDVMTWAEDIPKWWRVQCPECYASGPEKDYAHEAVNAWNQRVAAIEGP